jgi:hypothetical protein
MWLIEILKKKNHFQMEVLKYFEIIFDNFVAFSWVISLLITWASIKKAPSIIFSFALLLHQQIECKNNVHYFK